MKDEPAFPAELFVRAMHPETKEIHSALVRYPGLTERKIFAAMALQGIMANPVRWTQIADDYKAGKKTYEECSRANAVKAVSLADALIAELNRKRDAN